MKHKRKVVATIYYQHEHTTKKTSVVNAYLCQRSMLIGLVSDEEEVWVPKERVSRVVIAGA